MIIYLMVILVSLIIIAFIPIQIHISYQRINKISEVQIILKVLFISISKKISTPMSKAFSLLARPKYTVGNIKSSLKANKLPERNWGIILRRINIWIPRIIQILTHALKLTTSILKPIKCKKLDIYTEVGAFDAAQTGLTYGTLWSGYSFLISQLSKWMVLKPEIPMIKIVPDFNSSKFNVKYDCIITFPLGHIIIVLIQTARFIRVSSHLIKGIST